MINYIWASFIIIGIIYGFLTGTITEVNTGIIESIDTSLELIMKMIPIMCLWLGIMNIAKQSGLLEKMSSFISPFLRLLFPELPKEHESLSLIASNMVMNILGLGNAATPFGLKAMKSLQEINKDKETASRSMITFLVINTASITLIPTTVISFRLLRGASNPSDIVLCSILTTISSCLAGLILDRIFYHIRGDK